MGCSQGGRAGNGRHSGKFIDFCELRDIRISVSRPPVLLTVIIPAINGMTTLVQRPSLAYVGKCQDASVMVNISCCCFRLIVVNGRRKQIYLTGIDLRSAIIAVNASSDATCGISGYRAGHSNVRNITVNRAAVLTGSIPGHISCDGHSGNAYLLDASIIIISPLGINCAAVSRRLVIFQISVDGKTSLAVYPRSAAVTLGGTVAAQAAVDHSVRVALEHDSATSRRTVLRHNSIRIQLHISLRNPHGTAAVGRSVASEGTVLNDVVRAIRRIGQSQCTTSTALRAIVGEGTTGEVHIAAPHGVNRAAAGPSHSH